MTEHGRLWMNRNVASVGALDKLRFDAYGLTQAQMNERLFAGVPLEARIIELGCNAGRQLDAMEAHQGRTNLFGADLAFEPLRVCRWRPVQTDIALLPYRTACADVVFTSGTMIHLPPEVRPHAMKEMMRVTRRWIIGVEPWRPATTEMVFGGALIPTVWADNWAPIWSTMGVQVEYAEVFPRLDTNGLGIVCYRVRVPVA